MTAVKRYTAMSPSDLADRRTSQRLLRKEEASIQLVFPCEDGTCRPEVAQSVTLDVSIKGFRLLLPKELEPGHIYDVCVDLAMEPKRFLLTGETRWCRYNSESACYEVGIEILPGEDTDFESWEDYFNPAG